MGQSQSLNVEALPVASPQGIGSSELSLLEAFAAASPEKRKDLLSRFGPGTPQHAEMLSVVCEQLGYPKDLETQLFAAVKASVGSDAAESQWPAYAQRYLFRKRLNTLGKTATLPTKVPEGGWKGDSASEEAYKLLDTLKRELGMSTFHHSSYPVPVAATGAAKLSSPGASAGGSTELAPTSESSSNDATIGTGWSNAEDAPSSWLSPKDFSSSVKWAEHIKEGLEDAKHHDGKPVGIVNRLKFFNFAHEHPALLKAASANDKAAWAYLEAVTSKSPGAVVPDVDNAVSLIKTCLSSSWVHDRAGKHRVGQAVFSSLTLAQLKDIRGFFSSWPVDVEMVWLQEVIKRLQPVSGVDLSADENALRRYCDEVWAVLEKTAAAESAANNIRVAVAYHRLRLAYSSSAAHSWNTDAAKQCLLDLLKIPMRGVPYEKSDSKGFFASISTDWWLRHAGYASSLRQVSTDTLALPTVTKELLVDAVSAALLEILGSDRSAKPSTKKNDEGANLSPWDKYASSTWLSAVQAAGQILSGRVDPSKWQSQLETNRSYGGDKEGTFKQSWYSLEELRNDTYLRFSPGNKEVFTPFDSDVAVSFDSKNISKVTVKLFELNTTAFYADKQTEISSDIELDGLQPIESSELDLEAQAQAAGATAGAAGGVGGAASAWSPFVSTRVKLPLASLCSNASGAGGNKRGVWVVELTGGSQSVRAIIRIGSLRIVERKTVSGHILTVLDEKNAPLGADPAAAGAVTVTLNGRRYTPLGVAGAAEAGPGSSPTDILVPYATASASGSFPLMITLANPELASDPSSAASPSSSSDAGWSFSSLVPSFRLSSESYTLEASFSVDRESLIKDNYAATLLVRPRLLLHGLTPAPLATLVNVALTLTSVDAEGSSSTRVFKPFVVNENSESLVPFSVPPGLRSLSASLSADYETIAEPGKKRSLSCERRVEINGIDSTSNTRSVFLRKVNTAASAGGNDGGFTWAVYLLGKTGEPVPGVSMSITLTHLHLSDSFYTSLTTDKYGAVYLGPLHGYSTVQVSSFPLTGTSSSGGSTGSATFELPVDTSTFPTAIHTSTVGDGGAFWLNVEGPWKGSLKGASVPFALQASLPFRPPLVDDNDKPVDKMKYVLTRRDISIVEVRPKPAASKRGGGFITSSSDAVRVVDLVNECSYSTSPTEAVTPSQLAAMGMSCAGPHACYDPSSGFIHVHGLPAGEFEVVVKRPYPNCAQPSPTIRIRVLPAPQSQSVADSTRAGGTSSASEFPARLVGGFLASGNAALEVHPAASRAARSSASSDLPLGAVVPVCPLQVSSISIESATRELVVRVSGGAAGPRPSTSKDVRIHVFASYFVPSSNEWEAGASLSRNLSVPGSSSTSWALPRSRYLTSRTLSEEVKYVLDRQALLKGDPSKQPTPGNLLPRPSLLMNPFSLGPAESSVQEAKEGSNYASHADGAYASAATGAAYRANKASGYDATSYAKSVSLDFLTRPAVTLLNQRLSSGVLRIPLESIAMAGFTDPRRAASWDCQLTVVAADSLSTAASQACLSLLPEYQRLNPSLPTLSQPFRDLTKGGASNVPLDSHIVHSSRTKVLDASAPTCDIVTGGAFVQVEPYGSIDKVFSLFASLASSAGNSSLSSQLTSEWSFLLSWPAFTDAEKQAKYSKYACHELHLFLFFKDQAFFNAVVKPYLRCKRAKSFIDRWVLNEDVSGFVEPAAFDRLNALERALLAARLGKDKAPEGVASLLRDAVEVSPTSINERDAIFKAALASEGLGSSESDACPPPPPPPAASSIFGSAPLPPMQVAAAPMMMRAMMGEFAAEEMSAPPPPAPCPPAPSMSMSAPRGMMAMAKSSLAAAPAPMQRMAYKKARAVEKEYADMDDAADEYAQKEAVEADESDGEQEVASELALRGMARRVGAGAGAYRKVERTEELAEQAYWRVRPDDSNGGANYRGACYAGVAEPNEFWRDFGDHCATIAAIVSSSGRGAARESKEGDDKEDPVAAAFRERPFVSAEFGVLGSSSTVYHSLTLNRMLLAIAVLGLPLERSPDLAPSRPAVAAFSGSSSGGATASSSSSGIRYSQTGTPLALFYQSVEPAGEVSSSSILLGQSYYDPSDRYEQVRGVRNEKPLKPLPCTSSSSSPSPRMTFEMLVGRVYCCQATLTNVSSESVNLEVLLTIPRGSLPASNGFFSSTKLVELSPFSTRRLEYSFYFPSQGTYGAFPAHAGSEGELLAYAQPTQIKVVSALTSNAATVDWPLIAANGTLSQVTDYLSSCNLYSVDIKRIFYRLSAKESWAAIISVLRTRQHYVEEVWNYAFLHGDVAAIREYLGRDGPLRRLRNGILSSGNPVLSSSLITIRGEEGVGANSSEEIADELPIFDPSLRSQSSSSSSFYVPGHGYANVGNTTAYAHLEYSPLVQARAHVLGTKRKILNASVDRQWRALLTVLACKKETSTADRMAVVYHLLLQDRVAEAKAIFAMIPSPLDSVAAGVAANNGLVSSTRSPTNWQALAFDYCAGYLDLFSFAPPGTATAEWLQIPAARRYPVAAAVASAYASHPVPKWAGKFHDMAQILKEADAQAQASASSAAAQTPTIGSGLSAEETGVSRELARESQTTKAAAKEPQFELKTLEDGKVTVSFANLHSKGSGDGVVAVRCYRMDLEVLFSSDPFATAAIASSSSSESSGALGAFAFVRPNGGVRVPLPAPPASAGAAIGLVQSHTFELPEAFFHTNTMVELVANPGTTALRRSRAHFANSINVAVNEAFGRLTVTHKKTGAPLARVYVKVFFSTSATEQRGEKGRFYKDGYTAANGVFPYADLSTDEANEAKRFAVFVSSTKHGSCVLTAKAPAQ